jgi:predicted metal-dependent peptidase
MNLSAETIYDQIYKNKDFLKKYRIMGSIGEGAEGFSPVIISPANDILLPDDIRTVNHRDKFSPDLQERKELRQSLLGELTEKLKGIGAGDSNQELNLADSRRIDWKTLLRKWLFERIRGDWKTYPFSKKHIWRNIYLPSVALDVPSHVVLAIDTSGSVPDSELSKVFVEVQNYRDIFPSQLTVIQCDAKIQHIQEYESEDYAPASKKVTVLGRGGTDFRPVFDWIKEQHFVSLPILIYATDGYGAFPEIQPNFPVIWIAFQKSIDLKKFPFGEVIELDSSFNLGSTHKPSQ